MGCHFLLQGIFPAQGCSTHLLHWQADSLPPSHQGSPCAQGTHFIIYFFNWSMFALQCCVSAVEQIELVFRLFSHIGHYRVLSRVHRSFLVTNFIYCCCCLVIKSCLTLCDSVDCSTTGFPVLHYLPEFA